MTRRPAQPPVAVIKERIDPLAFYRHELGMDTLVARSNGWADGGLCPFHDDHRPGSFRVNTTTGAFKCFSCGGAGGDIIGFIMQRDGLTFRQAVQHLEGHGYA